MNIAKRPKGLGRGLDALLGGHDEAVLPTIIGAPNVLALTALQPGKYQPRTRMDEGALAELADSIRAQGLIQPILVRRLANNDYEIIAGERRWRAARIAGLQEVPVVVKDVPDEHAAAMALIENIQREDLNALEEAQGISRLIKDFGLSHEQAAQAVGKSRSATSNLLRLLNLAKPVQTMLMAGDIDMGHARALLAVDAATQITLANQIIAKSLSVREAEKLVTRAQAQVTPTPAKTKPAAKPDRDVTRLAEDLAESLGMPVVIKPGKKGAGKLTVEYHSHEALDTLIGRIKP
jgi:ParB family transcriptional regulator, chromosome partitioning protein